MTLGMREAVVALIILIAGYMLFVLLRMRRLNAARSGDEMPATEAPLLREAPAPTLDELLREAPDTPPPAVRRERPRDRAAAQASAPRAPMADEVEALRRELATLRQDMEAMRQDLLHEITQLRAGQSVSPLYSEAMQMAVAGYSAAMIAERCGIARAEAEMVVGLARSQQSGGAHG